MSAMTKKEWMEYLEKTWDAAQKEAWSEPQFECARCGHCCRIEEEHMSRGAMQQALEALESDPISHAGLVSRKQAIAALRQALETEQEPVAWLKTWSDGSLTVLKSKSRAFADHELEPLYAAPPKKQWVGLTDEEVSEVIDNVLEGGGWLDVARAIEQALKEKNQ